MPSPAQDLTARGQPGRIPGPAGSSRRRPVLSRYLQGLAKGVPLARIETAVDELELRLDSGRGPSRPHHALSR